MDALRFGDIQNTPIAVHGLRDREQVRFITQHPVSGRDRDEDGESHQQAKQHGRPLSLQELPAPRDKPREAEDGGEECQGIGEMEKCAPGKSGIPERLVHDQNEEEPREENHVAVNSKKGGEGNGRK